MAKPKSAGDGEAKAMETQPTDGLAKRNRAPAPADPPAVKEASTSPRAKKAAAEKAGAAKPPRSAAAKAPAKRAAPAPGGGPDLRTDLRAFAAARPEGWNHDDWLSFLAHLSSRGHDTADAESIGMQLERERLGVLLERVQGMGPRRVQAMVERYDTLYSIRGADVDELASLPGMNRSLAEKVRQSLG